MLTINYGQFSTRDALQPLLISKNNFLKHTEYNFCILLSITQISKIHANKNTPFKHLRKNPINHSSLGIKLRPIPKLPPPLPPANIYLQLVEQRCAARRRLPPRRVEKGHPQRATGQQREVSHRNWGTKERGPSKSNIIDAPGDFRSDECGGGRSVRVLM